MTGEHDNRQVLTRALRHIAVHCGERLENSRLIRRAVVQKRGHDFGIEATTLRVDEGARHVLRIPVSKFQLQVACLGAIVADADGQHMQPGAGRFR